MSEEKIWCALRNQLFGATGYTNVKVIYFHRINIFLFFQRNVCVCVPPLIAKIWTKNKELYFWLKKCKKAFESLLFKKKKKIYIGAVHKWCHPFGGEGVSAEKWCYSISLFSKMGDKGEGQKFQKMGDVIMDDPILTTQKAFLLQKISFPFVQNEFQNSFF